MDSKAVSRRIREQIRPCLQENGFSKFTDRNAWRLTEDRIDVVNFQSFNSYLAEKLGCTTYSFSVNLGVYFRFVPDHCVVGRDPWENPGQMPKEYECSFRGPLKRSFPQRELSRRDIWYIDPDGNYLEEAVENARVILNGEGMVWFDRFDDIPGVLNLLLEARQDMGHLWGFGNRPSPMRSLLTGYFALKAGQTQLALTELDTAASSPSFSVIRDRILQDMENAT